MSLVNVPNEMNTRVRSTVAVVVVLLLLLFLLLFLVSCFVVFGFCFVGSVSVQLAQPSHKNHY